MSNPDGYRRYPEEEFAELRPAIFATSLVDRQNRDVARPEALESMAEQINEKSLWMMSEHNPRIPPLGRILCARRFHARQSGVYFVAGVCGFYDPERVRSFTPKPAWDLSQLTANSSDEIIAPVTTELVRLAVNPHELPSGVIEEMLRDAPSIVERDASLVGRKSADPMPIVAVIASAWLLTSNPFSKKVLEVLGEQSARTAIEFASWIKNKVISEIAKLQRECLFVLQIPNDSCTVEFVVPSNNTAILIAAIDSVQPAVISSMALAAKLSHTDLEKLVYEYDLAAKQWIPIYAATRLAGVISNRPALMALDRISGLSVGGKQLQRP